MKPAMEIIGAATAAFVLTTVYLQHEKLSAPVEPSDAQPHWVEVPREAAQPFSAEPLRRDPLTPTALVAQRAAKTPTAPPLTQPPLTKNDVLRIERREILEFAGGLANIAPLSTEQKEALLKSKLKHREVFDVAMRDAGMTRNSLSPAERTYAHETAIHALNEFRENFLMEANLLLNEEQYSTLVDFEATEFKQRLANLQAEINSK